MTLDIPLSEDRLAEINAHLSALAPEEILLWALDNLPGLHQTTAFGLTGLAIIHMLSTVTPSPPPLIFIDTLYHFNETLDLVERVKRRYGVPVSVYRPEGIENSDQFEEKYGRQLWIEDEDRYDYLVKVKFAPVSELLPSLIIETGGASKKSLQRAGY